MKKRLLAFSLALIPMLGFSQNRSESEAIAVAQEFWGGSISRAQLKAVPQKAIASAKARVKANGTSAADSKQSFYVINDEEHGRFVIVSSDDRLYKILGYSDNGTFDPQSAPEGLLEMMNGYDNTYNFLSSSTNAPQTVAKEGSNEVLPFIKTQWHQIYPYNAACPIDPRYEQYADNEELYLQHGISLRGVTGCIATAMAQVMNYYKYPACGHGSISYKTTTFSIPQSMSFSTMPFDWNNMADTYADGNYTEVQKNAVAQLMHVCGNSVVMDYTSGNSGALNPDLAYALIHYFDYNPNIRHYEKNYFSSSEWKNIIQNDLEEGRPVIYSGRGMKINDDGTTSTYGHAFILDGCDAEGKYHVNWGYNGQYDGYFELSALDIDDSNFNLDQAMVCNIAPQTIGESEDVFFADKFIHNDWLQSNKSVGGYASTTLDNVYCYSVDANTYNTKFNGEIGVGLFDANRNFIKSLDSYSANMNAFYGWSRKSFSFTYDRSTFTEGSKYNIAPYAKSNSGSKPTFIKTTKGVSDAYNVEVSDGKIIVRLGWLDIPTPPIEIVEGYYSASAFNFSDTREDWKVNLSIEENSKKVWFTNIDPIAEKNASVYGEIIGNGTQIRIPAGQKLGENKYLYNYSSTDDIIVYVSGEDSTMTIQDTWGAVERSEGAENASQNSLSKYSSSVLRYVASSIDDVEDPVIIVNNNTLTMSCSTKDAKIYYTLDGKTPTENSTRYTSPIELTRNCTIKAIAILDKENVSDVVEYTVATFVVDKPMVSTAEDMVSISCETDGAKIYYTTDGTTPREEAQYLYGGSFQYDHSFVLKAFAVKEGYTKSEMIEQSVIYVDPDKKFFVQDNTAGQLSTRVSKDDLSNVSCLEISGEMNGTDFKHLYSLLEAGNITDLNLANARIVSGGEPYDTPEYLKPRYTENDVIGEEMFYGLTSLVTLTLPNSATVLSAFAINKCDNIGELTLPLECIELNMDAIYNCKNLHTLTLGGKLQKFNSSAIKECDKLSAFVVDESNSTFKAIDGVLFSKDGTELIKYPRGLQNAAYIIPENVTRIGDNAFEESQIESVTLPGTLQVIGRYSFSSSKNLSEIVMPNSVESLGTSAFSWCKKLKKVVLSDNIREIPNSSFIHCIALREFLFGKNVNKISDNAFEDCSSLQRYDVSAENNWYCSVDGVLFSKNMHTLQSCPPAFYSLHYIVPDGVTVIANNGFSDCVNVEKVTLPESVTRIGSSAFLGCKNMASIVMPNDMEEIGSMAFWNCSKLESLIIPNGVRVIPMSMARMCRNLSYVSLPSTISEIKHTAFEDCTSLRYIRCGVEDAYGITVEKRSYDGSYDSFEDVPSDCTWYVPEGSEDSYKAQPWWVSTWSTVITGIESIYATSDLSIVPTYGAVEITSPTSTTINIYNLQGRIADTVNTVAGVKVSVPLSSGIYVVEGKKVHVK